MTITFISSAIAGFICYLIGYVKGKKEAYNQALEDAAAKRPNIDDSWCISGHRDLYYVSSESILKLKK